MLFGLTIYTASYIAEIVRGGIQAVPFGQHEASAALGLSRGLEMRLVLLPQALRVIIPPVTSQYLNLTKNSSLAVAVGYPDLVSIANTSLNQTGRAIECIAIIMACYLTLSLLTAWFMNVYNGVRHQGTHEQLAHGPPRRRPSCPSLSRPPPTPGRRCPAVAQAQPLRRLAQHRWPRWWCSACWPGCCRRCCSGG